MQTIYHRLTEYFAYSVHANIILKRMAGQSTVTINFAVIRPPLMSFWMFVIYSRTHHFCISKCFSCHWWKCSYLIWLMTIIEKCNFFSLCWFFSRWVFCFCIFFCKSFTKSAHLQWMLPWKSVDDLFAQHYSHRQVTVSVPIPIQFPWKLSSI